MPLDCASGTAMVLGQRSLIRNPLEDFTGWKVPEGDGGHWRVIDGIIEEVRKQEEEQRVVRRQRHRKSGLAVLQKS